MDADEIIVGAGPVGLMLACELRLANVSVLVMEQHSQPRETAKANGVGGQILRLLHYRGLLDPLEALASPAVPAPGFPFGSVHVDLSSLTDSPLQGLTLPQWKLEHVLAARASELGALIQWGCWVVGVEQSMAGVTVRVRAGDLSSDLSASFVVGCDGSRSSVRENAGIDFPGTTYPEVNRLGQVSMPDKTDALLRGDVELPGLKTLRAGEFVRTQRGLFGFGWLSPGVLMVSTTESDTPFEVNSFMTLEELQTSITHVLGANFPMGEAHRLSRYRMHARQADRYRAGRVFVAGDAAHFFPATGVGLNAGLSDAVNLAWKLATDLKWHSPSGLLDTYDQERRLAGNRTMLHTLAQLALKRGHDTAADALREIFLELFSDEPALRRVAAMIAGADISYGSDRQDAHPLTGSFAPDLPLTMDGSRSSVAELLRSADPLLLDLADRAELRSVAQEWAPRVKVISSVVEGIRPADAFLIRPDAHLAWAASVDEPEASAASSLREALHRWFGTPRAKK